jgi:hypothetical protein
VGEFCLCPEDLLITSNLLSVHSFLPQLPIANLASMDERDIYNMIMDAVQFHPAFRDVLSQLPPIPANHYHCSCCGGIVIPEGTSQSVGFVCRWFRAIAKFANVTWRGLHLIVHIVLQILGGHDGAWLKRVRFG